MGGAVENTSARGYGFRACAQERASRNDELRNNELRDKPLIAITPPAAVIPGHEPRSGDMNPESRDWTQCPQSLDSGFVRADALTPRNDEPRDLALIAITPPTAVIPGHAQRSCAMNPESRSMCTARDSGFVRLRLTPRNDELRDIAS